MEKKIDRQLKAMIAATVRDAVKEALEGIEERWVSEEELTERFACFTPWWLRHNGKYLPRTKVTVVDSDGVEHPTKGWCYPIHKINRMMMDGSLMVITGS